MASTFYEVQDVNRILLVPTGCDARVLVYRVGQNYVCGVCVCICTSAYTCASVYENNEENEGEKEKGKREREKEKKKKEKKRKKERKFAGILRFICVYLRRRKNKDNDLIIIGVIRGEK